LQNSFTEELNIKKILGSRFLCCVIILILGLTIIASTLLVILWSYLEKYESSTPQFYIHKFINNIKNDNIDIAMENAGVKKTEFFSTKEYKQYLSGVFASDFDYYTITRIGTENNKAIYEVAGKSNKNIKLELTKKGEKKQFGIDSYSIRHIDIPFKSVSIYAPSHIKLECYGKPLSPNNSNPDSEAINSFNVMNDKSQAPKPVKYKLDGFLVQPEIEVKGIPKSEYTLSQDEDSISISTKPEISDKENVEELAVLVSKTYAQFVSQDAKFSDFSKYLLKDTSYYDVIKTFSNTWYVAHDSFAFEDLAVKNTVSYSDVHFSTEVSFKYIITKGKIKNTYQNNYRLSLIKQGNTYKIVNLESV